MLHCPSKLELTRLALVTAELLQGGGSQLVGGIIIVTLLPLIFIAWAAYFVFSYLHQHHSRRAAFILEEDPVRTAVRHPITRSGSQL